MGMGAKAMTANFKKQLKLIKLKRLEIEMEKMNYSIQWFNKREHYYNICKGLKN
jgi:hypothetical protein